LQKHIDNEIVLRLKQLREHLGSLQKHKVYLIIGSLVDN